MKNKKTKILLQTPKGARDILPADYSYFKIIYKKAEEIADYYGFLNIQTPHLEKTELFTASLGEATDIIEKQMYSFRTQGKDHLTLRPEGTASIMRSYIEHGMHTWPQPVMLQYKGSFFRHEKPQKGKLREFQQFGLEIIGEEKAIGEAIIIKVSTLILEELGIKPIVVHINSLGDKECRPVYRRELIAYYRKKLNNVCEDCKKRFKKNPLRLLDCDEEKCQEIKKQAPQMVDYLCTACKKHFKEVLEFLDFNNIPYFFISRLVRGLDYYSRTVFEIFENEEEKEKKEEKENELPEPSPLAIGGGGRYDYLAKILSNKNFPAVGASLGIDRIAQLMTDKKIKRISSKTPKIFFIQLGTAAKLNSLNIIEIFRNAHLPIAHSIGKDNLKSQLRIASKLNISYALILGQKEALENSIIIREMSSGNQETVPIEKVVEIMKQKI
jgi:histidyl-tRNA synthetase